MVAQTRAETPQATVMPSHAHESSFDPAIFCRVERLAEFAVGVANIGTRLDEYLPAPNGDAICQAIYDHLCAAVAQALDATLAHLRTVMGPPQQEAAQ